MATKTLRFVIACCIASFSLGCSTSEDQASSAKKKGPTYLAGQVWTYKTRKGDEGSTVTILRVDKDEAYKKIYHVRIDRLPAETWAFTNGVLPHLPVAQSALKRSLIDHIGDRSVPDFTKTYAEWLAARRTGETPAISMPLSEAIDLIRTRFLAMGERLPAYLPEKEKTQPIPKDALRLRILVVEPGKREANRMTGRKLRYELAGKGYADLESLGKALLDIRKTTPIFVDPGPKVVYGDVAGVVTTVTKAGFDDIRFARKKK